MHRPYHEHSMHPNYDYQPPYSYPADLPKVGETRCYWSLLNPDLEFVYCDPVLASHLDEQADRFIGQSLLTFVHPDEAESAKRDLRNVLDKGPTSSPNEAGSVTRVRYSRLSRIRRILGYHGPGPGWSDAEKIAVDSNYMAVDIVINWAAENLVLCFTHAVVDLDPRGDNTPAAVDHKPGWSNFCGTSAMNRDRVEQLFKTLETKVPPPSRGPPNMIFQILANERERTLMMSWPPDWGRSLDHGPLGKDYAKLALRAEFRDSDKGQPACQARAHLEQTIPGINGEVHSILIRQGTIIFACHKIVGNRMSGPPTGYSHHSGSSHYPPPSYDHYPLPPVTSNTGPYGSYSPPHPNQYHSYHHYAGGGPPPGSGYTWGSSRGPSSPGPQYHNSSGSHWGHPEPTSPSSVGATSPSLPPSSAVSNMRTGSYPSPSPVSAHHHHDHRYHHGTHPPSNSWPPPPPPGLYMEGGPYHRMDPPHHHPHHPQDYNRYHNGPDEPHPHYHPHSSSSSHSNSKLPPPPNDDTEALDVVPPPKRRVAASATAGSTSNQASSSSKPLSTASAATPASGNRPLGVQKCSSCKATSSPEWRKGPSGKKELCNACGLRYARSRAKKDLGGVGGGPGGRRRIKDKALNVMRRESATPPVNINVDGASPPNSAATGSGSAPTSARSRGGYSGDQQLSAGSSGSEFYNSRGSNGSRSVPPSPTPSQEDGFVHYAPGSGREGRGSGHHSSHSHHSGSSKSGFYGAPSPLSMHPPVQGGDHYSSSSHRGGRGGDRDYEYDHGPHSAGGHHSHSSNSYAGGSSPHSAGALPQSSYERERGASRGERDLPPTPVSAEPRYSRR